MKSEKRGVSRQFYQRNKGRGSVQNESSRFHMQTYSPDLSDFGWAEEEDLPKLKTEFFFDDTKTILSKNSSPDLGFTYSINSYRGCEHGCSYCYARPSHEYLGLSAGLDFETKIFVKRQAPTLLRQALMAKSWDPDVIMMSGITDCYQPLERKFELTRACLQVLAEFKNPVSIITKNALVTRDIDILSSMAKENLAAVTLSITSLNQDLAKKLEPRTSAPKARLQALEELSKAGIPAYVNVAPVIPGLNDYEIPAILKAAADAGALAAGYTLLRLPYSVKDIFSEWLETQFPERKSKVLSAVMDVREGQLNEASFGSRMRGEGARAEHISSCFKIFKRKFGLDRRGPSLNLTLFRRPGDQLSFSL